MIDVLTFLFAFALGMYLRERAMTRNRLLQRILPDVQGSDPQAILEAEAGDSVLVAMLRPVQALAEAVAGPVIRRRGMEKLRRMYDRAGRPGNLSAEEWYLAVLVTAVVGALVALPAGALVRPILGPIAAIAVGVGTRPLSNRYLQERIAVRVRQVRTAQVGWMESLVTAIESGAPLARAIRETITDVPGILGMELMVAAREAQADGDLGGALGRAAERLDVPELSSLVAMLRQQMDLGGGVAEILRAQVHDLREARRSAAEEKAGKATARMLWAVVPLVLVVIILLAYPPGAATLNTLK